MNLWGAVSEFSSDYYAACGRIYVQERNSQKLFQEIIDKASKNFHFRERLINSPVEALAKEGFKLPEGFTVKFVEETEDTIFIPIPPYVGKALYEEDKDE